MIDYETLVYDKVARAAMGAFPGIYATSTYVAQPARFPALYLRRVSAPERGDMVSSSCVEEGVSETWEAQVYSALADGGRTQAKLVLGVVDGKMRELGYERTFAQEMDNAADTSVSRYVARWTGTVDKNGDIYGR